MLDHKATIVEALQVNRVLLARNGYWDEHNGAQMIAINAALAWVQSWGEPQALDMPDSVGWWALEGRYKTNPDNSTFQDVVEVVEKNGKFIFGSSSDWVALEEVVGKWTRLHTPWEGTQP